MIITPNQRIGRGRELAIEKLPYMAPTIVLLRPIESTDPKVTTVGTDALGNMYWSRKFLEEFPVYEGNRPSEFYEVEPGVWSTRNPNPIKRKDGVPVTTPMPMKYMGFIIAHEACHLQYQHLKRSKEIFNVDHSLFNVAADCVENTILEKAGFTLMPGVFTLDSLPRRFPDGVTAEVVYEYLINLMKNSRKKKDSSSPDTGVGQGKCGSCCSGQDPVKDLGENANTDSTTVETAIDATFHEMGKCAGSLPKPWQKYVQDHQEKSKIPWTRIVKAKIDRSVRYVQGSSRPNYHKPHRKMGQHPDRIVFPRRVDPRSEILLAVDTSGSTGPMMATYFAEVCKMTQVHASEYWLMEVDCKVNKLTRVRNVAQVKRNWGFSGGGTDFRPIFDGIEKLRPRPNFVIVLTDAEGLAPTHCPPGLKVLWCVTNRQGTKPRSPDTWAPVEWGEYVWIQ